MKRLAGALTLAMLAWGSIAGDALAGHGRWQQLENKAHCTAWNAIPQTSDTATWTGDCVDGKAKGYGTLVWRYLAGSKWKKQTYTGSMRGGREHGRGEFIRANGDRYTGDWRDGKRHGIGTFVAANGGTYEGGLKNDQYNGKGVSVTAEGNRYEGQFKNGVLHGPGVVIGSDGKKFKVEFRDGTLISKKRMY
jgi:hypothetical protein